MIPEPASFHSKIQNLQSIIHEIGEAAPDEARPLINKLNKIGDDLEDLSLKYGIDNLKDVDEFEESLSPTEALQQIRNWFIDPETGLQYEEWPSACDFIEHAADYLRISGIWFDKSDRPIGSHRRING